MSSSMHPRSERPATRQPVLLLAEYSTTSHVVHAAEKVRDAGYSHWDTHTPFPIHGMDSAMGLKDSRIGWIVLVMGVLGLATGLSMYLYMNEFNYPIVVGGKPPGALPAAVPVYFELTVLFSAFGAVFGMLHLNRLPRHNHPIFESDRFRAASDDKFFVSIEACDPKFNLESTRNLLESTHPSAVELIEEKEAHSCSH